MKEKFSLNKLKANPKIPFLIAGAAAIAIIVVAFLWAHSTPYGVLFGNVNDKDGGEIVSQLEQMKIPYKFSANGTAILIPEDKVYETRLRMAQQGLPKSGAIGFELLDKERFGISQFSEQINYQRALEGELSRTIATLSNIENVRVHLALPKPSLFVRERKLPSASVTLTLASGRALSQEQINAITHLISSSVSELTPDKVTIVDQNGDLLTDDKMRGIHLNTTQLEFTDKVENRIRKRIEKILTPLLGQKNLSVQVSADVDFSRHEVTSELYDPNTDVEKQSIRSKQSNEQRQTRADNGIGGVPGALSNQPVPVASAPIDNPDVAGTPKENEDKEKKEEKDKLPQRMQRSETVNYEVNRKAIHSQTPEGNIKRLTVAVLVNYKLSEEKKTNEDSGKEETVMELKPLDDSVIQKIEALTKEAMGFSTDRGDSITVANLKFNDKTDEVDTMPIWKEPEFYYFATTLGRYLIFILIIWLIWSKFLKPQWNKLQQRYEEKMQESLSEGVSNGVDDIPEESRDMRYKRIFENSMQQQRYLREVVTKDPKMTANILRNWINRDHK